MLIIRGSGFGEKPDGTDEYINIEMNGDLVDIISWNDNRIKASVSRCPDNPSITVNALFGTTGNGNKPPKPDKGR